MVMAPDKPKLTDRQEDFCQYYVQSNNAYEAALQAKYAPTTAKANSYKLLDKVEIKTRIAELKEANGDLYSASLEEKKQILWKIARDRKSPNRDRTNAIQELNRMEGDHAAQKLNIEGMEAPRIIFAPHPTIQIAQIEYPEGMPILPASEPFDTSATAPDEQMIQIDTIEG